MMNRKHLSLSLAMVAVFAAGGCTGQTTNATDNTQPAATANAIQDVSPDYHEVCVNGVVYYRRKPKSGFSADYALSPKIVLPPETRLTDESSNYGSYQRC